MKLFVDEFVSILRKYLPLASQFHDYLQ